MSFSRLYEDIIKINIKADYKSTNGDHFFYQALFSAVPSYFVWYLFGNFSAINREKTLKRTKSWQTQKKEQKVHKIQYIVFQSNLFSLAAHRK